MSLYRRGEIWWYKFWFAGRLIRESAKTTAKTLAREAEKKRRRELEEGYNGITAHERSKRVQTFEEAAEAYLKDYAVRRRQSSHRYMKQRIAHLRRYFGNAMLIEIGEEAISEYQTARLREGAAASSINNEVMVLLQIMGEIGDSVRLRLRRRKKLRLKQAESCGRALNDEEIASLLEAARVPTEPANGKVDLKATRSRLIYPAIMIAINTAMRESEIRTMRWGQVDFLKRIITVGQSKTAAGAGRTIPINGELFSVLAEHKAWYEREVAPVAPDLFLFPFGADRAYQPDRPITTFKRSWTNVRKKAGIKVRLHDLRHTAITRLAESGAGDETIMAIAGHVSRAMLSRYAHIRTEAKRRALEAIAVASSKQDSTCARAS
jgi:integrase